MKIVPKWTMDGSHVDYADQMTRSHFLSIALTTPQLIFWRWLFRNSVQTPSILTEILRGLLQYVRVSPMIAPGSRKDGFLLR